MNEMNEQLSQSLEHIHNTLMKSNVDLEAGTIAESWRTIENYIVEMINQNQPYSLEDLSDVTHFPIYDNIEKKCYFLIQLNLESEELLLADINQGRWINRVFEVQRYFPITSAIY